MAHDSGSFDYKVIKKEIRDVLDNRTMLNNTVQLAMPFVKATTTLQLKNVIGEGNVGFSLGMHGIDQDVKYEDMYSARNSNLPLIGYTYGENGQTRRVYATNPSEDIAASIFDTRAKLFSSTDYSKIAPPGITQVTIGRNKNGLLASAQLNISVPSLIQLESLHRTFLIPGIGMVLEWGQQFAQESNVRTDVGELPDISYAMFPWHNRAKLKELLTRLGKNEVGLVEILNKYVYPTQGQYMWMFGRVANFSINANVDGSFDCTVKIVGPSEDSWAYSTKNTIVPAKDATTPFFCASDTNSVSSYFSNTTVGLNLKTALDATLGGKAPILGAWKQHVVKFDLGNKKGGEPTADDPKANTSQASFADAEDAYFMTWRYFVNVILNNDTHGVKAIFKRAGLDQSVLNKIGTLLPYADGPNRSPLLDIPGKEYIDDPMESFVGMNKYLRSTDPSVLIIVNEDAAKWAASNPQYNRPGIPQEFLKPTSDSNKFSSLGWFDQAGNAYNKPNKKDRAFLSTGVWLNHKAVIEAMLGGETIIRGISNLLNRLNSATLNYWQLTLDVAEPLEGFSSAYNYMVVDANLKETSANAVSKFIDNVHIFNKYVRSDAEGNLVGSELLECSVDLSLPKRLFSQIATMGLVQPEDLKNAGVGEDPATGEKSPKLSTDDKLREMFVITSLATKTDDEQGPDLTIPPKRQRNASDSTCGKGNTQTTGQSSGVGNAADVVSLSQQYKDKSIEDLQKEQEKANELLNSEYCKKCDSCPTTPSPKPSAPPVVVPPQTSTTSTPTVVVQSTNKKLSELTISEVRSVQKPSGGVLAVGKYQAIPSTLSAWIVSQKIPTDTIFDSAAQEKLGDWLLTSKRPNVAKYIGGIGTVTLQQAQLSLAQEFASLPIPGALDSKKGYYDGKAGNRASVTSGIVQAMLMEARRQNNLTLVKEFIAKGEGNYDAINRGRAGDTKLYSTEYYAALNSRKSSNTKTTTTAPSTATPSSTSTAREYPKTVSYKGKDSGTLITVQVLLDQPGNTQSTQKLFNAGYRNGRINTNNLVDVGGGFYLIADAAAKWKELVAAASADGVNISISEGYRSLDKQIQFIKNNGLFGKEAPADSSLSKGKAAQPGKSNHGWAIAFDLNVGGKSFESNATYKWLRKNAARFQFKDTVRGGSPDEPWHWEYIGPITKISPTDTAPVGPSDTTTPPITSTPIVPQVSTEAAAAPRIAPSDIKVCSDEEYLEIGESVLTLSFISTSSEKINTGKIQCAKCDAAKKVVAQLGTVIEERETVKAATDKVTREFPGLQNTFRYVEIFPDYMAASIADSADGDMSNAFGSAPGSLSISADLVMPGINGIRVGELFWIDRIPTFYRTFGAFQIISVEDTIDISGWKTKIYSQFNYLGKNWKDAMLSKFREATT